MKMGGMVMTVQAIAMDAYRVCKVYGSSTAIFTTSRSLELKMDGLLILLMWL